MPKKMNFFRSNALVNHPRWEEYLCDEYDCEANEAAGISLDSLSYGSHKEVFWKCEKGHQWRDTVKRRTSGGKRSGCPECQKLINHPRWRECLRNEYDYKQNEGDGVDLDSLSSRSATKVAWRCERGHQWRAEINRRIDGAGCRLCQREKLLLIRDPAWTERLSKMYDYAENEKRGIVLDEVTTRMTRPIASWICPKCGHPFDASVHDMANGRKCPYCETSRKTMVGLNDLATTDPDVAAMFHPTMNGDLNPTMLRRGSHRVVWWLCPNTHPFEMTPNKLVTNEGRCPVCSGRRLLSGANDLQTLSPDISLDWDEKRNGVPASQVLNGGSKLDWWKCHICGYEWQESRTSRTFNQKSCPACSGYAVLQGFNDLATTDPSVATEWDYERNGDLTPQQVTRGKDYAAWWICPTCGESYDMEIYKRTGSRPQSCPYCAGKRVGKSNSLATCFPHIAAEWHPTKNGNKRPEDYTYGSHKEVWWLCPVCGHSYRMSIRLRTSPKCPQGCPKCIESSYERTVRQVLEDIAKEYDLRIVPQWKHDTCKMERPLRFDFAVFSGSHPQWRPWMPNLLIEVQGQQHYRSISFFGGKRGYKRRVKNDKKKSRWCVENGVMLYQVPYVWDCETIRVRVIGALVDAGVIPSLPSPVTPMAA